MSSKARLDLSVPVSEATLNGWLRLSASSGRESIQRIASYLSAIAGGPFAGSLVVTTGAVNATATITSGGISTDSQTMSLCNVSLTAKTSGADPTAGEFDISAVVATQAANIALAINSTADFAGIVTATSSLGVVTVTAVAPGAIGNGLQISESLDNVTVTQFASGADGTAAVTVRNGY